MTALNDRLADRRLARPMGSRTARCLAWLTLALLATSLAQPAQGQSPRGKPGKIVPLTEPLNPAGTAPTLGDPAGPPPIPTPSDEPKPAPSKKDEQVSPAAGPGAEAVPPDTGPLAVAKDPPGGAVPAAGQDPSGLFMLTPDRLMTGKQYVRLSVEVAASPVVNLGKETTVKLFVNNDSNVDAQGVSVYYQLPEGFEYLSSSPPGTQVPAEKALYNWKKATLAAGQPFTIVLKVKAVAPKPCEHAATVTARAGSRANTTIQEPKLKVEQTINPSRTLKGEQVTAQITVRNPGTGPARNVVVQAKLSSGLRFEGNDIVEQTIDVIKPGGQVVLEDLQLDTIAGGQQSCTVEVRSPDVNAVVEDQRVTKLVDVTKPELLVKLAGPEYRFTDQIGEFKVTVTNPGTAPAKGIRVAVTMPPQGGRLKSITAGEFDVPSRKLLWNIDQLEPGQSNDLAFVYMTGGPGLYKTAVEAVSRDLRSTDQISTDVSGIPVLDLQVVGTNRVIDVGKNTIYDITITNKGTKEATRLQLMGTVTKNLKVVGHYNVEKGELATNEKTGEFKFPEIDRLAPGQALTVSVEVQGKQGGAGTCHVQLAHADMGENDEKVEDVAYTIVTGDARPSSKPK
jgi:uncharacterized repeat protein (TIGR01451 family)